VRKCKNVKNVIVLVYCVTYFHIIITYIIYSHILKVPYYFQYKYFNMNQKVPSGATKRKKKLQQTQHFLKTNTKIMNYFECNQHVKGKLFTQKYLTVLIILIIINVFCISILYL